MLVQAPAPTAQAPAEAKHKESPRRRGAAGESARWPYGLLLGAMAFGAGLMVLGLGLQESFAPGLWSPRQAWLPAHPEGSRALPAAISVRSGSVEALQRSFARIGYELPADGAARVPRLRLAALPDDLSDIADAKQRKTLFLKTVLPMVLSVNEQIREARREVLAISKRSAQGVAPDPAVTDWLADLERRFGIESKGAGPATDALLERLDEVPVALALAQAAIESGWGTSRFAREGNALFGQRTWKQADGLVPKARGEGESFRVRRFKAPVESVWSYVHNLNTSPAYDAWRARRAALRASGRALSASALLAGLEPYSEKGAEYTAMLGEMIRKEKLGRFQKVRLAGAAEGD